MGAENWNFLKLLKTVIVVGLSFCLGLFYIKDTLFFEIGHKMTRGAKTHGAYKNVPNLLRQISIVFNKTSLIR